MITFLGTLPVMMNPAIMTLSAVSTARRLEILIKRAGASVAPGKARSGSNVTITTRARAREAVADSEAEFYSIGTRMYQYCYRPTSFTKSGVTTFRCTS